MSQSVASALNNRIVTFVNINDEYNCVICMQIADDPVRCSGLCAGIFCNGCMQQALRGKKTCPSCNLATSAALKDVVLRNQIMKHQVYCTNKSNGWTVKSSNRKQKAAPDQKCKWTGKYDELSRHMKQCDYEIVACVNEGCDSEILRYELAEHLQVCLHRSKKCNHCADVVKVVAMPRHLLQCPKVVVSCECGFECLRDALTAHRDKDCPLVEIYCDVIGCDAKMKRGDYEKHQEQTASYHVRLLSAALKKCLEESIRQSNKLDIVKQENTRQSLELGIVKQENTRLSAGLNVSRAEIGVVKQENDRLAAVISTMAAEIAAKPPTWNFGAS